EMRKSRPALPRTGPGTNQNEACAIAEQSPDGIDRHPSRACPEADIGLEASPEIRIPREGHSRHGSECGLPPALDRRIAADGPFPACGRADRRRAESLQPRCRLATVCGSAKP